MARAHSAPKPEQPVLSHGLVRDGCWVRYRPGANGRGLMGLPRPSHTPIPKTAAASQLPGPRDPVAPNSAPAATAPTVAAAGIEKSAAPRVAAPQAPPIPIHSTSPTGPSSGKKPRVTSAMMTTATPPRLSHSSRPLPARRTNHSAPNDAAQAEIAVSQTWSCPECVRTLAGMKTRRKARKKAGNGSGRRPAAGGRERRGAGVTGRGRRETARE